VDKSRRVALRVADELQSKEFQVTPPPPPGNETREAFMKVPASKPYASSTATIHVGAPSHAYLAVEIYANECSKYGSFVVKK
jgi:hypothetical protein